MSSFVNDDAIKKPSVREKFTEFEIKEFLKCKLDVEYFIEEYVKVQHPTRGAISFKLYDYQKEALNNLVNYRNNIFMFFRQAGKTILSSAFLLHFATFNRDKTILVVANKLSSAVEIMDRIKFIYKELPDFIRDSVVEFNKTSITFKNGSRIICRATSADSSRGLSVSLLYCDEMDYVPQNIASAFWTSVLPTLRTGGSAILTSTPKLEDGIFGTLWKGANDTILPNGEDGGIGSNGFKASFATWKDHPEIPPEWEFEERKKIGDENFEVEYNCQFVNTSGTLINPLVLSNLKAKDPIFKQGEIRWFKNPEPGYSYYVALDPSLGTKSDSSSIQIIEMPTLEHVGEWTSNTTPPKGQVQILYDILNFIHMEIDPDNDEPDIFWSFENNTIGEAVLQTIEDSGVDMFPGMLVSEKRPAQQKKRFRKGLNTTNKNKLLACSKFKSLVDTGRFVPKSVGSIKQLKNFTANGASFSSKGTNSDDLVMSLILCVRLIEMTKDWDIYDPEILEDVIDKEYREPMGISFSY